MFSYLSWYCPSIWCEACLSVSFQVYPCLAPFLWCTQGLFAVCVHISQLSRRLITRATIGFTFALSKLITQSTYHVDPTKCTGTGSCCRIKRYLAKWPLGNKFHLLWQRFDTLLDLHRFSWSALLNRLTRQHLPQQNATTWINVLLLVSSEPVLTKIWIQISTWMDISTREITNIATAFINQRVQLSCKHTRVNPTANAACSRIVNYYKSFIN